MRRDGARNAPPYYVAGEPLLPKQRQTIRSEPHLQQWPHAHVSPPGGCGSPILSGLPMLSLQPRPFCVGYLKSCHLTTWAVMMSASNTVTATHHAVSMRVIRK